MDGQLFKICAIALIAAVTGVVVRQIKNELSFAVKTAGGVVIFGLIIAMLQPLLSRLESIALLGESALYIDVMLRALGIAILAQITSGICRDCGEDGVASGVELASKIEILILCMPLINKILEYAEQIVSME
ncbi:MAG: hypothetical protein IJ038_02075 [Clostridia bacterium]|nr:hypothetical protein [Clostridia bacterium]